MKFTKFTGYAFVPLADLGISKAIIDDLALSIVTFIFDQRLNHSHDMKMAGINLDTRNNSVNSIFYRELPETTSTFVIIRTLPTKEERGGTVGSV